jgi:hypothetical protein
MEQSELLRHVVDALERLRISYLVTGSTATIAFGEPRFTNDIDIVVDIEYRHVADFCRSFPAPEFYLSDTAVRQAIHHRGQVNLLHPGSGLKVDLIIRQDTPFDQSRFARGVRISPEPGLEATFASPEDVIVKKLEYYRDGGSEKHLRDITGVLRVTGERIDRAYIERWAAKLGLETIWQAVLARVGETR